VLLVTVDTLRPDYLSFEGYDRRTTPRLDVLLARGVYFERTVAPVPRTTPALASLFTGAYPHGTGVRRLTDRLPKDVPTLTQVLRDAGYQTFAVVTNQVLGGRGLARGFSVYDLATDARRAQATTESALALLESVDPARPVFGWVHYIDPHVPYHPSEEIAREFGPDYDGPYALHFGWNALPDEPPRNQRPYPIDLPKARATHRNPLSPEVNAHVRRLYAGDVRGVDAPIAELVAAAEHRLGDVIVIFTSDHGESLGEHDFYFDHGDYVYDAGTRVPLAIVLPPSHPLTGAGSGRCSSWVSLVDVAPTLLELTGTRAPRAFEDRLEGRSLVPCLRGDALAPAPVFAEAGHSYSFELVRRRQRNDVAGRPRAVTLDGWKLIWTPFLPDDEAYELYDLAEDPGEARDLYRPDHPRAGPLREALEAWLARAPVDEALPSVSEADREALRRLGYIQ
jgi:arylsulfatase A-like enzyme